MSDPLLRLLTLGLTAVTVVLLGLAIRRLRHESRLTARSMLLGFAVPLGATAAYLILGGQPYSPPRVGVTVAIGLAIGVLSSRLTRIERRTDAVLVRQTGATMIVWSVAYAASSLASLAPSTDPQAVAALAMSAGAGLAAGSQLGLYARTRSGAPQAASMAAAGWTAHRAMAATGTTEPPPLPAAPVATPMAGTASPVAAQQAPPALALSGSTEPVHFTHSGARFLLGYTTSHSAIWDRSSMGTPVAQFPQSANGRAAAWGQFSAWEPAAAPIPPYPGLSLAPVADGPVAFSYVGIRFAIGRTAVTWGIWDRWTPGAPVATFPMDPESATRAWQTFSAWEPAPVAL